MTTPDWKTVKRIAADALELPTGERSAFVDQACGGDAALRQEVDGLLPRSAEEELFLEPPTRPEFEAASLAPGAQLGRFRLGRVIGEGGMGRVHEATQDHPRRTVALKILRPGSLGAGATRRFEWEIEALARLDHPAIATVFEAGTATLTSGEVTADTHSGSSTPSDPGGTVPWFAMELVDGLPLLTAADRLELDRRGRLVLFLRICEGVAHAHSRGIIHRDLKPDNVLVDPTGQPRILDFGIARSTDGIDASLTAAGQLLGTPDYMAPEQLTGDPAAIDVRADIHALGNLLYRLLTGHPPYDLAGLSITQVALRMSRDDPTPASRHDRTLAGDLETILATALAREPRDRYASVEQLADDIRRFLDDLPITARPPSAIYQLRKLARRHRGLATGLLLSLLLLIVAVVGTSVGLLRAEAALQVAAIERDRYQASTRLLSSLLESADPDVDGREIRVVDLLDTAGAELAANAGLDAGVQAAMHLTLGRSYQRLGLGETAAAQLRAAIGLADATDGASSELALDARAALAELLLQSGQIDDAAALTQAFARAAAELDSPAAWIVARPLELAALRHEQLGEADAALADYRQLASFWETRSDTEPDAYETALNNLGVALLERGDLSEAEALLRRSVDLRMARLGADHPSALTARANLAISLTDLGRLEEAARIYAEVVPRMRAVFGDNHRNALSARNNQASTLGAQGDKQGARSIYAELLAAYETRFGPDHHETWTARNNLAVSAIELGDLDVAARELRALLGAIERAPSPTDPVFVTRTRLNLAAALEGLGQLEEALELSAAGLQNLTLAAGGAAMPTMIARNNHALLLAKAGNHDQAVALARTNLELARQHYPDHPMIVFPLRSNLARVLSTAGQHDDAIVTLREVERSLQAAGESRTADLRRCQELLDAAVRARDQR